MLRTLPFRGATLLHPARSRPGITFATPVSPQPAFAPILVSGTYRGTPAGITLVWRQGGADVGAPGAATSIENGLWSATITTPSVPGSYTLRASFDGTNPIADSAPIEIGAAQAGDSLATFTFEGTGAPADTITLFGHAFPEGAIKSDDPVLLRLTDTNQALRTQMNVLSKWNDGSVKTTLLAAELPFLIDGATLGTALHVGEVHGSPGPDLSFVTALSGRSAAIKTWAPSNTSTPLWTFDPLAAIGADRWHEGPLALSTRVETAVPASAVQNTSGTTGVIASVRLIVDITVTKDGILRIDACFSNDRVLHSGGGDARFGYTLEIDGETLYDQRPASGAGIDLKQYCQWIRCVGRNSGGTVKLGRGQPHEHLHYVRPDIGVLVRSGLMLNYDLSRPLDASVESSIVTTLTQGDSNLTDPYWPHGLARFAGQAGGREEIGYRTRACGLWLRDGSRNGMKLAHRQFEAASVRPMYFATWKADYPDDPQITETRWMQSQDWPKFTLHSSVNSPAGTSRLTAVGLPTTQRPHSNSTDYITADHAHQGSFCWTPALLSGRRLAYDGLAAKAAWTVADAQNRGNGQIISDSPQAVQFTPDADTGRNWAIRPWMPQTRGWGWDMRDNADCAAIIPDSYPNASWYKDNARAWVNSLHDAMGAIDAIVPLGIDGIGMPICSTFSTGNPLGNGQPGFMFSFCLLGVIAAIRSGVAGDNAGMVLTELARWRAGSISGLGYPYRNALCAHDEMIAPNGEPTNYQSTWSGIWSATQTRGHSAIPPDWSSGSVTEGDWQRNMIATVSIMSEMEEIDPAVRAQLRDGLVLLRSERRHFQGAQQESRPSTGADQFFYGNFATNSLCADDHTWMWNTAPMIPTGQLLSAPADLAPGEIVGFVRWTGPIPRNSAEGTGINDAFVIASQPEGDPFTISPGGVVRLGAGKTMPVSATTFDVYCRTYSQELTTDPNTEHRSATVEVNVVPTYVVPEIAEPVGGFEVGQNADTGLPIFTPSLANAATQPVTWSKQSGDTSNLFSVDPATGLVTVGASLSGRSGESYSLVLRAANGGGYNDRAFTIDIIDTQTAPVIAAGQTVTVEEGWIAGTAVTPDLAIAGSAPSILAVQSGDPSGRFATELPNRIKTAAVLNRADATSYTLGIRAANVAGEDTESVTVNVLPASWIWDSTGQTDYLAAYDLSRRLRSGYAGPLFRAIRLADSAEQDFGASGTVSVGMIEAFADGGQVEVMTLYDQGLIGNHLATSGPSGRPRLTNASGVAYAINARPVMYFTGNRGLKKTDFALLSRTDFAVFVVAHATVNQDGARIIAMSATDGGDDQSGTTSFRFLRTSSNLVQVRRNGLVVTGGTATNWPVDTTRVVLGVAGNETGWGIRTGVNTSISGTTNGSYGAMTATCALRLGHFSGAWPANAWEGLIGRLVITSAVEKTGDLAAIRDSAIADYAVR